MIPALIAVVLGAQAQGSEPLSKEIFFITDNDNYLLQRRDGYYTNGFNLAYQRAVTPRKASTQKAIMRYELGQMIFNPWKYSIVDPEQMDRPFAGYLFVKLSRSRFFKNNANFQYGASLGLLGPSSGAQSVQRKYHSLINIYEVRGWGYQLRNEPSLNLHGQYTHPLYSKARLGEAVDLHAVARANIGNAFTNAAAGLFFRIGAMESSNQSVAWNSRIASSGQAFLRRSEFFVFFQPEIIYQAYNATLQGGMFLKNKGPVTASLNPLLYQHRVGFMYSSPRFGLSVGIIHRTKESKDMRRKENYGSLGMSYRIR